MSMCMRCRAHATFNHTVFQGTSPTTIKLCDECATSLGADGHIAAIKSASDHEAKNQAVTAFLAAVAPPADLPSGQPTT